MTPEIWNHLRMLQSCPFCGGRVQANPAAAIGLEDNQVDIRQRGSCSECGRALQRVVGPSGDLEASPGEDGLSGLDREFWSGEAT
jgi:hypothetical protein